MSIGIRFAFLLLVPLWPTSQSISAPAPKPPTASGASPAALPNPPRNSADLRAMLKATNEEWSVIFPKLQQIDSLREEVNATAASSAPGRNGMMMEMLNHPMGDTSLDTPTVPPAMVGMASMFGRGSGPFDPKNAPGAPPPKSGMFGAWGKAGFGGAAAKGDGGGPGDGDDSPTAPEWMQTGKGNSVGILLAELQTLLASKDATDAQIHDKLASVRAARRQAARDLAQAEAELTPLLTLDQRATLLSLGRID